MPVIANPPRVCRDDGPSGDPPRGGFGATARRAIFPRLRVAVGRRALTRELSEGVDPASSPERSVRAAQLTSRRTRRQLARTLRRTIGEAHRPPMARSRIVIIRRVAVIDAEDALNVMIDRLGSSEPVRAEGMAIAERILTEAEWSPLYNRAAPGALRQLVRVAIAAMGPRDWSTHEFPIAVGD
jgi:hypothetical protein